MKRGEIIGYIYASEVGDMIPTQADARAINQDCTQAYHSRANFSEQNRIIHKFLSDDYNGWY